MNKLQMNNHFNIILIVVLFFIACSEEKVQLISNTPSDLPDQNYKLNLRSPDSGENLETVTITWNETGGNVTLTDLSTNQTENRSGSSYTYTGFTPGDFRDIKVSGSKDGTTYTDTIQIFTRPVYPVSNFSFETEAIKVGEDVWNSWEKFIDLGDGIWNEGEPFTDRNGNNFWDPGEFFEDIGNRVYDEGELFFDKDTTKYHRNLKWTMTNESNAKYILYRVKKENIYDLVNSECDDCQLEVLTSLSETTYIDSSSNVIDEFSEDAFYYMVQVSTANFTRDSFIDNYTEFTQPGPIQLNGENVSTNKDEFIEITWNPIPNSDYFYQYEIWRASNEEFSEKTLITIITDSNQGKFMDRDVGNGITWYYSVAVRDISDRIIAKNFVSGWSMP